MLCSVWGPVVTISGVVGSLNLPYSLGVFTSPLLILFKVKAQDAL